MIRATGDRCEGNNLLGSNAPSKTSANVGQKERHHPDQHRVRYVVKLSNSYPLSRIAQVSSGYTEQISSSHENCSHGQVLALIRLVLARSIYA